MAQAATRTATKQQRPTLISTKVKKGLTLRELENSTDKSIYIVNTSPKELRGEILFDVPKRNGQGADLVKIAKTWIPQDLCEQLPRDQILESANFRGTLNKGLIKLVAPEYAEEVLAGEDAQQEVSRIRNQRNAANAILNSSTMTGNRKKDEDDEKQTPTQLRRKANLAQAEEDNETRQVATAGAQKFDTYLESLGNKGNETDILNELRSEGGFTKKELKKILIKFEDYKKICKWANSCLASLDA